MLNIASPAMIYKIKSDASGYLSQETAYLHPILTCTKKSTLDLKFGPQKSGMNVDK